MRTKGPDPRSVCFSFDVPQLPHRRARPFAHDCLRAISSSHSNATNLLLASTTTTASSFHRSLLLSSQRISVLERQHQPHGTNQRSSSSRLSLLPRFSLLLSFLLLRSLPQQLRSPSRLHPYHPFPHLQPSSFSPPPLDLPTTPLVPHPSKELPLHLDHRHELGHRWLWWGRRRTNGRS